MFSYEFTLPTRIKVSTVKHLTTSLDTFCEVTFNSTPAGTTMGLNESECGQMGVTMMAGTDGWIMDAPAATAYAVEPVGVEMMRPSP